MGYSVGEVSKLAGISVRALHHYDEVGLLKPSGRSAAGYRLYTSKDLERLQQVLLFREIGFSLEEIARILRDPSFDRKKALVAQRAVLVEKGERIRAMVALVDETLDALEKGTTMEGQRLFGSAGPFDPSEYEEEVKRRWGKTDAYAESVRRARQYSKEDWDTIRAEGDAVTAALAQAFAEGIPPTDPRALELVERHRLQIDRWFYPCSHAMHVGLGDMYVADPRFTATYDRYRPGLAEYVRDAIRANASRASGEERE